MTVRRLRQPPAFCLLRLHCRPRIPQESCARASVPAPSHRSPEPAPVPRPRCPGSPVRSAPRPHPAVLRSVHSPQPGLRHRSGEQGHLHVILIVLASVKDQLQGRSPVLYFELLKQSHGRRQSSYCTRPVPTLSRSEAPRIVEILVKFLHNRVGYLSFFVQRNRTLRRDRPAASGQNR